MKIIDWSNAVIKPIEVDPIWPMFYRKTDIKPVEINCPLCDMGIKKIMVTI